LSLLISEVQTNPAHHSRDYCSLRSSSKEHKYVIDKTN
jgi:hypothetical protein